MTSSRSVTIVQEYVPAYRAPLFREMKVLAKARGIDLRIAAGTPQGTQAQRGDTSDFSPDIRVGEQKWSVLGRRLSWRSLGSVYRDSDLVILEQARRNIDTHLALRHPKHKVALWGHGRDHTRDVSQRDAKLLADMTARAHWFFGYTTASVDHVVETGFPRERTTVLNNTTDTASLSATLADETLVSVAATRARLGLGANVATFIGALDDSKRLDFLLDAADLVARDVPDFTLVVAGDGPLRDWIDQQTGTRPWLRRVGRLVGKDLASCLAVSDIIAMPGRVGLLAVDALAAGVPIVTTDWPFHAPERAYLTANNSVTTANTAAAYANGITALLADRQRRDGLASCGRQDSVDLTIEKMAQRFVEGIEHALDA